MSGWRRALFVVGLVAALGVPAGLVVQKERVVRSGNLVLLPLAPVDPRSLMQGDYMILDYAVTRDAQGAVVDGSAEQVSEVNDIWTFSRQLGSRDPNWLLVATESAA